MSRDPCTRADVRIMQLDREFDHLNTMYSGFGALHEWFPKWGHRTDSLFFSCKENNLDTRFDVLIVGRRIIGRDDRQSSV